MVPSLHRRVANSIMYYTSKAVTANDRRHRLSDEEVVDRVRAGDTALYEVLIERYQRRLYCIALRILRNDSEAEDALQDAHMLALKRLDQFAGRSSFYTWMARITMNEAFMKIRGRARVERLQNAASLPGTFGFMAPPPPDPERQAFDRELDHAMASSMNALPDSYRMVFQLREMDEQSTSETAASLGLSEECVKTRLHRARELMRKRLRRTTSHVPGGRHETASHCMVN